jgi:hypothetical protein
VGTSPPRYQHPRGRWSRGEGSSRDDE